jgi:hypothetical protein
MVTSFGIKFDAAVPLQSEPALGARPKNDNFNSLIHKSLAALAGSRPQGLAHNTVNGAGAYLR